jgi:putative transposase
LLKSFKTEINPTQEQITQIRKTIGTCRYIYNFFILENKHRHERGEKYIGAIDFSKWMNNEYLPKHPELSWVKEVSSKSIKQSITNADAAYKRFFKGHSGFPRLKKKSRQDVKMYFVKTDAKSIIRCERHRIKIPTLGFVRLKEYGYLPTKETIRSGTISQCAGRFYVTVLTDAEDAQEPVMLQDNGIGVDLGIKDFAITSEGTIYKNINKQHPLKDLTKRLERGQRKLSRKYESLKQRNKQEKGDATRQNIQKQVLVVQKLHQRIANIRKDYINKVVAELVKTKPLYVTIEDLNVRGMMKNRHLSRAVAGQGFYEFRNKLISKCKQSGIEVRIVDRFYPSSKTCHNCGSIKSDLKLSDRTYSCECGYIADRDKNAALNLRDAKIYQVA